MKYNNILPPFQRENLYMKKYDNGFSNNPMASVTSEQIESWVNQSTVRLPSQEEFDEMEDYRDLDKNERFLKWMSTPWEEYPKEFIDERPIKDR